MPVERNPQIVSLMSSETWSIETFARLRPSNKPSKYSLDYAIEDIADSKSKRLEIEIPPETDSGLLHSHDEGVIGFNFNDIFDIDATQEQVFEQIAKQKVLDIFSGVNATVFAYGQTGSGKTYSIFGGDTFQDRGLIPRSLGQIFQEIKLRSSPEAEFTCKLSFTEVYKENLYDLLDPNKRHVAMEQWVPVQMFESEQGLLLRNVNVFEVDSEEKALNLFFMGNTNRITASTQMNNASSRSHAVFTVIIESSRAVENPLMYNYAGDGQDALLLPSSHEHLTGKLNLVDLAGSERMYKLQNSRNLISQAKSINLSLHFLEQVIISLRDSNSKLNGKRAHLSRAQNTHIPYRNSVLTSMLRDSLGGNCKSCFIITVASERLHFEETVSSCRFGQRCGEVLVDVHANKDVSSDDELLELRLRNEMLTKQLRVAEEAQARLEGENTELQEQLAQALAQVQAAQDETQRRARAIAGADSMAGAGAGGTAHQSLRQLSEDDHRFVAETLGNLLSNIEDNMQLCREQLAAANMNGGANAPSGAVDEEDEGFDLGFDETRAVFSDQLVGQDYAVVVEIAQALVVLVHQLFKEKEVEARTTVTKKVSGINSSSVTIGDQALPPPPAAMVADIRSDKNFNNNSSSSSGIEWPRRREDFDDDALLRAHALAPAAGAAGSGEGYGVSADIPTRASSTGPGINVGGTSTSNSFYLTPVKASNSNTANINSYNNGQDNMVDDGGSCHHDPASLREPMRANTHPNHINNLNLCLQLPLSLPLAINDPDLSPVQPASSASSSTTDSTPSASAGGAAVIASAGATGSGEMECPEVHYAVIPSPLPPPPPPLQATASAPAPAPAPAPQSHSQTRILAYVNSPRPGSGAASSKHSQGSDRERREDGIDFYPNPSHRGNDNTTAQIHATGTVGTPTAAGSFPRSRVSYISTAQAKLLWNGAMFCKLPTSTSNKIFKSMLLRTASGSNSSSNNNKQLRYVCVSHDLKFLKWKSFSTANHKKERAFGQTQADADVNNQKYINSPVPQLGKGTVSAKSAESSFLALSSIESISLEENPLQQGEMSKFSLWGGHHNNNSNNNNNCCPVILISALNGEKVLKLEFFCSVHDGARQQGSVSNSSKYDLTVMWLDALVAAVQQAQMIEKREREQEAAQSSHLLLNGMHIGQNQLRPHSPAATVVSAAVHGNTTYNMVNSGYIKKKMFQRDLMSGLNSASTSTKSNASSIALSSSSGISNKYQG